MVTVAEVALWSLAAAEKPKLWCAWQADNTVARATGFLSEPRTQADDCVQQTRSAAFAQDEPPVWAHMQSVLLSCSNSLSWPSWSRCRVSDVARCSVLGKDIV